MISSLSRNVLYQVAGQLALTVLTLVAVHVVYRRLGASSFGILAVSLVWTATLVSALELGLSSVVVRAVAAGRTGGQQDASGLLRSATTVYWLLTLTGCVLVYFGLPHLFSVLFRSISHSTPDALGAARILLMGGFLAIPRVLYQSVLRGAEQMGGYNVVLVGSQAVQQLGIYMLAAHGVALVTICWWIIAWYGVSTALTAVLAGKTLPRGSLVPGWDPDAARSHRALAASMATVSATSVLQAQGDESAVSWTLPVQVAGYYASGEALLTRAQAFVTATAEASLPAMTRAYLDGSQPLATRYRKLHDLVCFGSLPLYAAMAFIAGPLFKVLFSSHASSMIRLPIALLALGFFLRSTTTALYITAVATGNAGIVARINTISTLVIFPVVVVLTHWFHLLGASASWLLYAVAIYLAMVPKLTAACFGQPSLGWFRSAARLGPSLFSFVAGWLCLQSFGADRVVVVVACFAPAFVLHVLLSAILIGPELKSTATSAWAGLTGHLRRAGS